MKSDAPRFASFPVSPENVPTKHRAIFSSSFAGLSSHHVQPASMHAMPQRHRHVDDDSLRLIDDLTNRPMDVLYSDSRLATKKRSAVSIWATRILVFLICIAVGAAGSVFVRQLSTDPRKEVRKQLASQLTEQTKRVGDLTKGVNDLRSQIESESESLASWSLNQTMQDDEMVNGTLPVQGEGIVLTVANPLSVSGDNADSSLPRKWQPGSSRHRFRFAAACLLAMAIRSGGDRDQRQPPWRANLDSNRRIDDSHRSQFGAKPISNRGDRQSGDLGEIGKQDNAETTV